MQGNHFQLSHWNLLQSMPTGVEPACPFGLVKPWVEHLLYPRRLHHLTINIPRVRQQRGTRWNPGQRKKVEGHSSSLQPRLQLLRAVPCLPQPCRGHGGCREQSRGSEGMVFLASCFLTVLLLGVPSPLWVSVYLWNNWSYQSHRVIEKSGRNT